MRRLGFNEAVIWGLYTGRSWPERLDEAMPAPRARLANQLIEAASAQGIKVIGGLGVFSWGFEEAIRRNPSLGPTNPKAMCASSPEAWRLMEQVATFFAQKLPLDGVSMQSADQGRCTCTRCRTMGDDEYHSRINIRMAEFFRARDAGKVIAVSGWGMHFDDPASVPDFVAMGRRLDYLIDVVDSAAARSPEHRKRLIAALPCDFGTIGGPLVEPPLHWNRLRWFLPTARAQGQHLAAIAADGARACEFFNHLRANPGDEVSLYVAGKLLSDTGTPWETHLRTTLEELYGVHGATAGQLAELFISAEAAYMDRARPGSGDISLEPLEGSRPGPPVYLTERLDAEGRAGYAADLEKLEAAFAQIAPDVPNRARIADIRRCLANARQDALSPEARSRLR